MKTSTLIAACSMGNFLEWYDYALYGYLSPILARLFFPGSDPYNALSNTLLVFAIGFIMRPLGSIIFGMIGDRSGRKIGLLLSILLMTTPTILMGTLPTYTQVGISAVVFLILLRIVQGIPVGGEMGGILCYLTEIAPPGRKGFFGSWAFFGTQIGFIVCSLEIYTFERWMPYADFSEWGWRISFIGGGLLGIFGWYLRCRLHETPAFEKAVNHHQILKNPVTATFKNYKKPLFLSFCVSSIASGAFYVTYFFSTIFLREILVLQGYVSLVIDAVMLTLSSICLPLFGTLGDRYGVKRLFFFSSIGIMFLPFLMFYFAIERNFWWTVASQTAVTLVLTLNYALTPAFISQLFPTQVRYTGIGISYNVSNALLGGPAPFFCLYLIKLTGYNIAPAFYFMFLGAISLIPFLYKDHLLTEK